MFCIKTHLTTKFGLNWHKTINSPCLLYNYTIKCKYWNVSLQEYYWFGFPIGHVMLWSVYTPSCLSSFKTFFFFNSELHLAPDVQIWGCRPEFYYSILMMENWGLDCYLGSVSRVITDKIQQDKIHLWKLENVENNQLFLLKKHDKC